jgi:HlyD family secretion protein
MPVHAQPAKAVSRDRRAGEKGSRVNTRRPCPHSIWNPARRPAPRAAAALCVAAAVALSACGPRAQQSTAPPAPRLQTTAAVYGSVVPTQTFAGIIAPAQSVEISNTLSEPAASVFVQEGDQVHAGEVLAQLATQDLEANLAAAVRTYQEDEAKVTQAQYQGQLSISQSGDQVHQAQGALQQAQANLTQAQGLARRDQLLYQQGALALQDLQTQQAVVANDQGAVRAAQAALQSAIANQAANGTQSRGLQAANIAAAISTAQAAAAQADQIRAQIARATVTTPVDGVVVNRNLNPGEYPGTRTIFVIQQLSTVYAMLNAVTGETVGIGPGTAATVLSSSLPGRTFPGTVDAVLGAVVPGSTNATVKVRLANPGLVLRSGMAVTGRLALTPVSGTTVPVSSFLDDTHTSVAVNRRGRPVIAHVHEVATDGTTSVVTGLTAGDSVIVDGQQAAGVAVPSGTSP